MNYRDLLINQDTGEIDWASLRLIAKKRADRDYVGDAPPSWVRSEIENLKTLAYFVRRDWREARGLPDDTVYVTGFTLAEPKRSWA
jgi:hypothetical protein